MKCYSKTRVRDTVDNIDKSLTILIMIVAVAIMHFIALVVIL